MRQYFVAATGTDIGKTLITSALAWQMRNRGVKLRALKPLASGWDSANPGSSDAAMLLAAQGLGMEALEEVCPWRFAAPLAPDEAAAREGREVVFEDVLAFCRRPVDADVTLIEGVGGVMSPITREYTVLDWMAALGCPVILVTGSYVGSISHTLTALAVLAQKNIAIESIIINESDHSALSALQTGEALRRHIRVPMVLKYVPRLDSQPEIWKMVPDISKELL